MSLSFAEVTAGTSSPTRMQDDGAGARSVVPRVIQVGVPESLVPEVHLPETLRLVLLGPGAAGLPAERLGALIIGAGWITLESWRAARYYRLHNPTLRFLGLENVRHNMTHGQEGEFVFNPSCPEEKGTIRVEDVNRKETRIRLQFVPPGAGLAYVKTIMDQAGLQMIRMAKTPKRADMWEGTVKNSPESIPHYLEGETISKEGRRKEILITLMGRRIACYYCGSTGHWSNKCHEAQQQREQEKERRERVKDGKNVEKQLEALFREEKERRDEQREESDRLFEEVTEEYFRKEKEQLLAEQAWEEVKGKGRARKMKRDEKKKDVIEGGAENEMESEGAGRLVVDCELELLEVVTPGTKKTTPTDGRKTGGSKHSTSGSKAKAGDPGVVKTPVRNVKNTEKKQNGAFSWPKTPEGQTLEAISISADRQFLELQGDVPQSTKGKGEKTLRRSLFPTPRQPLGNGEALLLRARTPKRDSDKQDEASPDPKRHKPKEEGGEPRSATVKGDGKVLPTEIETGTPAGDGDRGDNSIQVKGATLKPGEKLFPPRSVPKFKEEPAEMPGGIPDPKQKSLCSIEKDSPVEVANKDSGPEDRLMDPSNPLQWLHDVLDIDISRLPKKSDKKNTARDHPTFYYGKCLYEDKINTDSESDSD